MECYFVTLDGFAKSRHGESKRSIYVGLYGLGLSLRTWRYHLLLKGAGPALVPAFGRLALVTAVRNMLVDSLPARTGSLSYW